jgi:hypothetical protein
VSVTKTHIRPVLGQLPVARIDAEVLDSFYAQLRRCRARCDGKGRLIDHRVRGEHECNEKCRPHVCKPLAPASIRKIHWMLSQREPATERRAPSGRGDPDVLAPTRPRVRRQAQGQR